MSFSCGVKSLSVTVHSYSSTVYCQYAVDRQCMALACERSRISGRRFSPREKLLFEVTTRNTSAFAQMLYVQCRRDWHNCSSVSILVNLWKQPSPLATWGTTVFAGYILLYELGDHRSYRRNCRLSFRNCKSCVYNCDDFPSYNSSPGSSHIWFSYIHYFIHTFVCFRLR